MAEPPAKRHDAGNHQKLQVTFIGGGQMCEALLGGLLSQGTTEASMVIVTEPNEARRKYLTEKYHVRTEESNSKAVSETGAEGIVILAVKPQVASAALSGLTLKPSESPLFISIMAGVPLKKLADMGLQRVARTMPNVNALIGCAACGYVLGEGARPSDSATVERVMGAVGICIRVASENLIDAVTGVSGSGPAYVYMLIESMADAGVKNGLPRDVAQKLAAQTVLGGAKMVIETGKHPAELRNNVESPGGTTIAGTAALETAGFRGAVISGVTAATERAAALGKL